MGKKLPHAPIFYVLAQVRFAALPKIDARISDVQEALRNTGFPDPFEENVTEVEFNMTAVQPAVQQRSVKRWISRNADRTAGFIFDHGSITYQTTAYEDSGALVNAFTAGLEILHKHVNIQLVDRVGVRTLDAVFPKDGETIATYIDGSVLGLYGKLAAQLQHAYSETVQNSERGMVTSRALTQNARISMPPDLQSPHFVLADSFAGLSGVHTMIDIDVSQNKREPFDLSHVKATMVALKKYASESFWKTVTPRAKEIWSQE
jgi:uncharacterized protein (TIGR04255 family)